MDEETIDGEAVEETESGEARAMVSVPAEQGVITPLDADQVADSMKAYQQLLPRLLSDSDYQDAGRGKRFVKKSGWRKIAKAFGLSTEIIDQKIERDFEDGTPLRASVIVRAIHGPTMQYADGDGHCSVSEERFSGSRGNKSKLENDLTATATTRAKNRAISDLVGMGDVSAEEVNAGPPYGDPVDEEQRAKASAALSYLLGPEAAGVWEEVVASAGGYMPAIVAEAIRNIARTRKVIDDAYVAEQEGEKEKEKEKDEPTGKDE